MPTLVRYLIALPLLATGVWLYVWWRAVLEQLREHQTLLLGASVVFLTAGSALALHLDRLARVFLHRPPACGRRVRALMLAVASEARFRQLAGLDADRELDSAFQAALAEAAFCDSNVLQGGYAGLADEQVVLALSCCHRRRAAAAHELFHLLRHVSKATPFPRGVADAWLAFREERIVWRLTFRYSPWLGRLEAWNSLVAVLVAGATVIAALLLLLRYVVGPDKIP